MEVVENCSRLPPPWAKPYGWAVVKKTKLKRKRIKAEGEYKLRRIEAEERERYEKAKPKRFKTTKRIVGYVGKTTIKGLKKIKRKKGKARRIKRRSRKPRKMGRKPARRRGRRKPKSKGRTIGDVFFG